MNANIKRANMALARVGLRHANMQDALATAYAKATHQPKDAVLEQLREIEARN
jgi:hypothetical protein